MSDDERTLHSGHSHVYRVKTNHYDRKLPLECQSGLVVRKSVQVGTEVAPHDIANEVALLRQLDHANVCSSSQSFSISITDWKARQIVRLLDYELLAGKHILTLPFYPQPMGALLNSPTFTPSECADFSLVVQHFMKEMLSAVAYLQQQGIAHRDVNPNNYLCAQDGTLVLTDFGIAVDTAKPSANSEPVYDVGTG